MDMINRRFGIMDGRPETGSKSVDCETGMKRGTGDVLGYARVSTPDQDTSGQVERLRQEGAFRVFEDVVCGKTFDRPGLAALLDYSRPGDSLAVTRLDRLGRSLRELLETVDTLKEREINLISLEEDLDTASAAGELVFHVFAAIVHFERRADIRAHEGWLARRRKARPHAWPATASFRYGLCPAGTRGQRNIRDQGRAICRDRKINRIQGDPGSPSVANVLAPFFLSMVLRTNYTMGPTSSTPDANLNPG